VGGKESKYVRRGFRVGVFMDSSNIYASVKDETPDREPDFAKLLQAALADNKLVRATAYCVTLGDNFGRWKRTLSKYGFEFKEKAPQARGKGGGRKGNVDMEMAMDVWRYIDMVDMVVLLTGDSDFVALVDRCHEVGKVVRVIGVPNHTSKLLIEAADEYVPLDDALTRVSGSSKKKESDS
jgi:uncharacterized LabA/DUF88 family protein